MTNLVGNGLNSITSPAQQRWSQPKRPGLSIARSPSWILNRIAIAFALPSRAKTCLRSHIKRPLIAKRAKGGALLRLKLLA